MGFLDEELKKQREKIKKKGKRWVRKGDKMREKEAESNSTGKRKRVEFDSQKSPKKVKENPTSPKSPDVPEILISEEETKLRLRRLGEPITFFGETQIERYKRLKEVELREAERKQTGSKGQKNEYQQVIMEEVNKELELAMAAAGGDEDAYEKHILQQKLKESKYDKPRSREECESTEEYVLFFFKRLLREWERMCMEMPDHLRRSGAGKKKAALQGQCRRDMRHLFKLLKKHTCAGDIVRKLGKLVDNCLARDYIAASQMYFQLAIGNAPWPVGVTAPGIHERAGRTKIDESQVAHVLNSEVQRKYIHAIERVVKFCQEKYPSSDITRNFNVDQATLSKFID